MSASYSSVEEAGYIWKHKQACEDFCTSCSVLIKDKGMPRARNDSSIKKTLSWP
jgi:hypothetical protein